MSAPTLVMVPGPTNLHPRVLQAMSLPMVAHTSREFYEEFVEILDLTRYVFQTKGEVVVFSGSGTLGMEAVAASLFERGDKVLSLETGFFGRRFTKISRIYGADVTVHSPPEGRPARPEEVEELMAKERYKALLVTHIETSMGLANDVRRLAEVAHHNGALAVVDSVCGVGGAELRFDDWGLDVAFCASQKALAAPPGAMLMSLSNRALDALEGRRSPIPSYYFDLREWLKVMKDPKIYLSTPTVPVLRALRVALQMVREEGLEERWARHARLSRAFREALREQGVESWAEDPSPTVTAIKAKEAAGVQREMISRSNVLVSRGLEAHKDDMVRVGHMGNVTEGDLLRTLVALSQALASHGAEVDPGEAVSTFLKALR
jgi:alanine-glyoxylate transaminase/serine-glyoxylate transaminase/serine-pyruvate transaminase